MTRKGLWPTGGSAALLLLAASSGTVWAQDLYVASLSGNSISKITRDGAMSTFATGLSTPYGLAFNSSRELFVANYGSNSIARVSQTGVVSAFSFTGATLNKPVGVAFAANGDLYVSNQGSGSTADGSIIRITPQGVASVFATGLLAPADIAFNGTDLFVTNSSGSGGTGVYRVTSAGVVSAYINNGIVTVPYGLAVAGNGDVYVGSGGNGRVSKKAPTGQVSTFLANGSLQSPMGMAFNGSDLYAAQSTSYTTSSIVKVASDRSITTYATGLNTPSGLTFLMPAVAVPEPGSITLVALGGLAGARLLRRRRAEA